MLIVEQNAALALELAEHAYLLETGRIVMDAPAGVIAADEARPPLVSRVLAPMELLLQQVMAGLANGAIYACMALAVVMIYQAIDHLNFAQGEMAMFSTFIAWQLIAWGLPYWVAFAARRGLVRRRRPDRPGAVPPAPNAPILSQSSLLSRCSAFSTAPPARSGTTRSRPSRRRSAPAAVRQ